LSLIKGTIHGIKWTSLSAIVSNVLGIIQITILSRLIQKSDFGLFAIAVMIAGFVEIFLDMGISNAIVYQNEMTRRKLSTLFWANIIIGIFFFILSLGSAEILSRHYNNQNLKIILCLMGFIFLVRPLGQQYMALMQKQLEFRLISKIEILARIISFLTTIFVAYLGWGVHALVFGMFIYSLVFTTLNILCYKSEFRPLLYFNISELKEEFNFGIFQILEKLLNYISSQFDTLLIGKIFGLDFLGAYSIAKSFAGKFFYFITPVLSKVTFPIMVKLNSDKDAFNIYHLRKINFIAYLALPFSAYCIISSQSLMIFLLGENWGNAIPVFNVLSVSYTVLTLINPLGVLLLSLGKARTSFYWNLFNVIIYPLVVLCSSYFGLYGILWGPTIMQLINYFLSIHFIIKPLCGLNILSNIKMIYRPLIFTLLSSGFVLVIKTLTFNLTYFGDYAFLIIAIIFFLIFVLLIYFYDRAFLKRFLSVLSYTKTPQLR